MGGPENQAQAGEAPPERRAASLDDQIALVRRTADSRANFLPGRVAARKMSQAAAEKELDTWEDVARSLSFVRRYRDEFVEYIERKREFERERAAELAGAVDGGEERA
mgnify:CR=1 FL=1